MLNMALSEGRKKILDLERKLKEQQSLYEGVRADRNLYSKNLLEAQDEAAELRKKIKLMSHQVEQLKEEISNKNQDLSRSQFDHSKLEKDKETLFMQIGKLQQQLEEANQMMKTQVCHLHFIPRFDCGRKLMRANYGISSMKAISSACGCRKSTTRSFRSG
jgi:chromosome segregation ATPase